MSFSTLVTKLWMCALFSTKHWLHLCMLHVHVADHWQTVACKVSWGLFSSSIWRGWETMARYISSVTFRFELSSFLLQNLVTTPVTEPQDGDAAFFGKTCVAVLVNTPGHWIAYVKVASSWWCLDSVRDAAFEQNPFHHQSANRRIMQLWLKQ